MGIEGAQGGFGSGGRKRNIPTGGSANGIPRKDTTGPSLLPNTRPIISYTYHIYEDNIGN